MKRNLIYYAHIPVGNQATIKTTESVAINTELEAISRDGLTITCNRLTLDQLLPNRIGLAPKQPISIDVAFALKNSDAVEVCCSMVAIRRLARDTFQIVMRYKDISELYFNNLDRYIDSTMKRQQRVSTFVKVA